LPNSVAHLYKRISPPGWKDKSEIIFIIFCFDGNYISDFTPEQIESAKASGKNVYCSQYHYVWSETDPGAPARVKPASKAQRANWVDHCKSCGFRNRLLLS